MSLFTDSDFVTQSAMALLDGEIPSIATADSITVDGASGVARQAWAECADILGALLTPYDDQYRDPVLAAHLFGVSSTPQLGQLIVGELGSAEPGYSLRSWMTWRAIVAFYRNASRRAHNVDRYDEKLERAEQEEAAAWRRMISQGLPMVSAPLPRPGAVHEAGAGTFSDVSAVSGGSGAGGSFEVAITWTSASYQSASAPSNGESAPSDAIAVTTEASEVIQVSLAGLAAPGSIDVPRSLTQGANRRQVAIGWNVYVGAVGGTKYLQNASPIPLATDTYALAGDPALSGYQAWGGQVADQIFRPQRIVGRG